MRSRSRSSRAQIIPRWFGVAFVVAALLASGVWIGRRLMQPLVTVTDVVEGPVVQAFYSTGTIQPVREYPIRSNVAGILKEVRVDKGARVKASDVLAIVEDPALVFAAQKAQAELEEKQHRADEKASPVLQEYDSKMSALGDLLEIARREQKRVTDLLEHNAGSQVDLDRAMDRVKSIWSEGEALKAQKQTKILEMKREVEVAQAALGVANWNLQEQTLKAPINGVVLDRPIAVGTRVAVNDPIMRIADVAPANLVMRAAVDEEDIIKVRVGQTVRMTLYSYPDASFSGTVTRIYDQADPDRRTFEVEVQFTNPDERFAPGMTGELAFLMAEKASALIVPAQALQSGAIYLLRDGKLVKTTPKIGIKSVERIEVLTDVRVGDRVVISPISGDRNGATVRTTWLDPREAAGLNKPPPVEQAFKGFSK